MVSVSGASPRSKRLAFRSFWHRFARIADVLVLLFCLGFGVVYRHALFPASIGHGAIQAVKSLLVNPGRFVHHASH